MALVGTCSSTCAAFGVSPSCISALTDVLAGDSVHPLPGVKLRMLSMANIPEIGVRFGEQLL
jgi:hypothetical protein